MDPNENLEQQRKRMALIIELIDKLPEESLGPQVDAILDAALEWTDLAEGLDQWLSKGGFLPRAWAAKRAAQCTRFVRPPSGDAAHQCGKTAGHEGKCV
jgi:hypothetical protein